MQTAVPLGKGGMAAVLGLDDEQVREVCIAASQGEVVQAANYNSPGQVVIAGNNAAIARAIEGCKEAGARRAMALSVSAPFHSELMKPAAEELAGVLNEVNFAKPKTLLYRTSMLRHTMILKKSEQTWSNRCTARFSGATLW